MKEYLMEFIGTFFLVLSIALTGNPLAIGSMLMVMVYLGGHVSGAHYNPAVTFAVWLRRKIKSNLIFGYVISQFLGAIFASGAYYLLKGSVFVPSPGNGIFFWQAMLAEILFTFALVSVILTVATTKKMAGNYIYGLAIGFTVMAGAYSVGNISGGVFNPAVGIGPMIFALFHGGETANLVLYIAGPLAGAFLAAITFKILNPNEN